MGIYRDTVDLIKDIKNLNLLDNIKKNPNAGKSISKLSKDGIHQFPCICTTANKIESTSMVVKSCERNYASFLQVVYSMNSVVAMDDSTGVSDYLRKFHQNVDGKTDLGDVLSTFAIEAYDALQTNNLLIEAITCDGCTQSMLIENRNQLEDEMSSFVTTIVNEKYNPNARMKSFMEASGHDRSKSSIDSRAAQLTANDVKKSNELVPTTLLLKLTIQDKNGNVAGTTEIVVGVKCVIHPVSSEEMIANLANVNRGKMFDFIRWTSGEISFFKDFLFNVDEIKTDVVNRSKGASKWWLTLKRRADSAKVGKRFFTSKTILPNATIICSMDEIQYLKANKNVDLMAPFYINKLMEQYFLLGFVIIDESSQLVYFMFDGNNDWETISFTGLERENSSKSNDFKEMLKLINRY